MTGSDRRTAALVLLAAFTKSQKKATVAELKTRVKGFFDDRYSVPEITATIRRVAEAMEADGLLELHAAPRSNWYEVSTKGRAHLEREFGGPVEPAQWKTLVAKHVFPSAAGVTKHKLSHDFSIVRAAMLAEAFDVGDRLSRAKTESQILNRILAAITEAKTDNIESLKKATVRRWLRAEAGGGEHSETATRATPTDVPNEGSGISASTAALDLAAFAQTVRDAANVAAAEAGTYKAFISHVWAELRKRGTTFDLDERSFHDALVEAHRRRLLQLTPASLAPSYDRADLVNSEIRWQGETFHFISTDGSR